MGGALTPDCSEKLLLRTLDLAASEGTDEAEDNLDALARALGFSLNDSEAETAGSFGSSSEEPLNVDLLAALKSVQKRLHRDRILTNKARQLEERLLLLSEASFEGILVHEGGIATDANQRLAELLGAHRDELIGSDIVNTYVAPEDRPLVRERLSQRWEGRYVVHGIRRDGSPFLAELASKELTTGDVSLSVIGVRDVTECERNLALLRESEQRLRQLVDSVFDATVFSRNGVIIEATGRLETFGISRAEMVGRRVLDFVPPSEMPKVAAALANPDIGNYETTMLVGENAIPLEIVGTLANFDGVLTRTSGLRDLRPLKRLEAERHRLKAQVERAQRLDSLGVLAGGIAHDFNNLLVGILGNADLLLTLIIDPNERELLSAIVGASQQARDLVTRLLAYSGRGALSPETFVPVDAMVANLLRVHAFERTRAIRIRTQIAPSAVVWGDRATLTQVLGNLVANAVDACEGNEGQVVIRASPTLSPDERWNHAVGATVGPGDWVLVEVADNGGGMDEATLSRIFEPFFSTKAHGHGLGLAACLGIVEAHGGAIHVRTQLGQGSCFSLLLPRSQDSPAQEQAAPAASAGAFGPILITDDEPLVRRQMRRTLELQGHTTLEASDGQSCLKLLESVRPSLLILDVTMPGLSGLDVVHELRKRGHTFPIIMTSGYMEGSLSRELAELAIDGFLPKPYSIDELLGAVQRTVTVA